MSHLFTKEHKYIKVSNRERNYTRLFTKEHKYIKVSNRERNYIQCHVCSQKNTNTLR